MNYQLPHNLEKAKLPKNHVYLVANGDLRLSANQNCWAAQQEMETEICKAVEVAGWTVVRAHPYKENEKHGFIGSQQEGMAVFRKLDPDAPLIVAEAVWQYSHHILHGLSSHRGPILTLANWSGTWPGLVGMLNLNGSLTKAGAEYSTLWTEDFGDAQFKKQLAQWFAGEKICHPIEHVAPLASLTIGKPEQELGQALAQQLQREKAIMGVFDEGCMGMFNAIIPDSLLNPTGVYKERLSQSALYYETTQVSDEQAREVRKWMEDQGMNFRDRSESYRTPHGRPTSLAMQDVYRCRADCRRFWLRLHWHPVPTRTQRSTPGQRPCGGDTQQRRKTSRAQS